MGVFPTSLRGGEGLLLWGEGLDVGGPRLSVRPEGGAALWLQPGPRLRACLPGRYLHAICLVLRKPSEQFLSCLS